MLFFAYKFISIQILSSPRFRVVVSTIADIRDRNIIGFFSVLENKLRNLLVPHCAHFSEHDYKYFLCFEHKISTDFSSLCLL